MALLVPSNALVALAAAASWGGGDFCGGMGVKRSGGSTVSALRVILTAHLISLGALLIVLHFSAHPSPGGVPLAWSLGAGVAAGLSLAAFYIALSRGAMGAAAAVAGLLSAAIPALVSRFLDGSPSLTRLAGFAVAAGAIWLIAAEPPAPAEERAAAKTAGTKSGNRAYRQIMLLSVAGGVGFGLYFVGLRLANGLGAVEPVALARCGSATTCVLLLLGVSRRSAEPSAASKGPTNGDSPQDLLSTRWLSPRAFGWALGVALLDTGGNLLYTEATRLGRLDVASVLAGLYPASTILAASFLLKERLTRRQLTGMGLALTAVILITL